MPNYTKQARTLNNEGIRRGQQVVIDQTKPTNKDEEADTTLKRKENKELTSLFTQVRHLRISTNNKEREGRGRSNDGGSRAYT